MAGDIAGGLAEGHILGRAGDELRFAGVILQAELVPMAHWLPSVTTGICEA
jgi:hypothetical protein